VDNTNMTGWPPLHLAAAGNHVNAITVLMRNGANPDSRNAVLGGGTALHVAARLGYHEAIETLVEREAQPDTLDTLNMSALHHAAARANARCVSVLLRSRADATKRGGHESATPLDLVPADHESSTKVRNLLSAYARPAPTDFRSDAHFDRFDDREISF